LNIDDRIVDLKKGEDIARKFNKKTELSKGIRNKPL
jgi:hypothetical protein